MSTWNEHDHPRSGDGTFTDKPGTSTGVRLSHTRQAQIDNDTYTVQDYFLDQFGPLLDDGSSAANIRLTPEGEQVFQDFVERLDHIPGTADVYEQSGDRDEALRELVNQAVDGVGILANKKYSNDVQDLLHHQLLHDPLGEVAFTPDREERGKRGGWLYDSGTEWRLNSEDYKMRRGTHVTPFGREAARFTSDAPALTKVAAATDKECQRFAARYNRDGCSLELIKEHMAALAKLRDRSAAAFDQEIANDTSTSGTEMLQWMKKHTTSVYYREIDWWMVHATRYWGYGRTRA